MPLYQDDLDTRDDAIDPIMDELSDDPTQILQIPPEEFKNEMDKIDLDSTEQSTEDMREAIEDRDEEMGVSGR